MSIKIHVLNARNKALFEQQIPIVPNVYLGLSKITSLKPCCWMIEKYMSRTRIIRTFYTRVIDFIFFFTIRLYDFFIVQHWKQILEILNFSMFDLLYIVLEIIFFMYSIRMKLEQYLLFLSKIIFPFWLMVKNWKFLL